MLTIRENFMETIRGGHPDRFVKQYEYQEWINDPLFPIYFGNIIPGGHLVSAVPGRTRRRWRESSANVGFLPWLFTAMRMESSRRNVIVRLSG